MTAVRYRQEGRIHELTAMGHAGYAKHGEPDIVCAAVSAVCCTLAGCLAEAGVRMEVCRLDAGDVCIRAMAGEGDEARVEAFFEMARVGMEMLGAAYPGFVRVQ